MELETPVVKGSDIFSSSFLVVFIYYVSKSTLIVLNYIHFHMMSETCNGMFIFSIITLVKQLNEI